MKSLKISDLTLCCEAADVASLTFRKKLDIASILDRVGVDVIELGEITETTENRLLVKSIASSVKNSTVSVSVGFDDKNVDFVYECLKTAKNPRLQVSASLSTSRMEYVYHKKANDVLKCVTDSVKKCKSVCENVEFCADDATRADYVFLCNVLKEVVLAGADIVTVSDTSGTMLPSEFAQFLTKLKADVVELNSVKLGVKCNNNMGLADAMAVEAIQCGVDEIKVSISKKYTVSLEGIINIITLKSDYFGIQTGISAENFTHSVKCIENLSCVTNESGTPFEDGVRNENTTIYFTENDGKEVIDKEIERLGYILSENDSENIFKAFKNIVSKKKQIDLHELEVIVASESMQVPKAYKLISFVVTTGNTIDSSAHIKLERDGKKLDGISTGNGSVDAAFLAIEKLTGCHYELDDFQIQAITEGKEAMGQTIVKLRSHGRVYSGRGVSTDIVSSAVNAYINALNKIVYEEDKV